MACWSSKQKGSVSHGRTLSWTNMRVRRRKSLATRARSCVTASASRMRCGSRERSTWSPKPTGPRRISLPTVCVPSVPEHDLLCEEGSVGATSGATYRWVVDPLDGTTNFAHGLPTFAVSIALEDAGVPVVGVVYDPMRDELFVARKGGGATLNGTPIHRFRRRPAHCVDPRNRLFLRLRRAARSRPMSGGTS